MDWRNADIYFTKNAGEPLSGCQNHIALFRYWKVRGLYETAVPHLEHAQEVGQRLDEPLALVQIFHKRGRLAVRQGDYRAAEKLYGEGLELAQSVDAEVLVCALQQSLGALMARQGKMALAEQWTWRALVLTEALGDADRRFNLLNNLGVLWSIAAS